MKPKTKNMSAMITMDRAILRGDNESTCTTSILIFVMISFRSFLVFYHLSFYIICAIRLSLRPGKQGLISVCPYLAYKGVWQGAQNENRQSSLMVIERCSNECNETRRHYGQTLTNLLCSKTVKEQNCIVMFP